MGDEKAVTTNQAPAMPAYMQKFMQQSQQDASSMAAASISVPRLSFRGKRFRFIEDGAEELVKDISVKLIILGVEPSAGRSLKTYYAKDYAPGDNNPPDCSSSDGVKPDQWVSNPQATACQGCPMNAFGSATSKLTGKPTKACKDGKRLWVSKPENPTKYYGLNVPVTSLRHLSEYGKYIGQNGFPLSLVVTEIGTDDDSEFPKLTFKHVGFVEERYVESIVEVNAKRPWNSEFASVPMLDEPVARKQIAQPQEAVTPQTPVNNKSIDDVIKDW